MDWKNLDQYTLGIRQLPIKKDCQYLRLIGDFELAKKNRKKVYIAFFCCPDYSYKIDSSGWCSYNHKTLGYGPGMTAYAYVRAILEIASIANELKTVTEVVLFYGDNEADDPFILKRLKISRGEFLNRVRCSISLGRIHVETVVTHYFPNNRYLFVKAVGLRDTIYREENKLLAMQKVNKIGESEIYIVAKKRRKLIESMYGLEWPKDCKKILDKAREQIFDRIIVGTALSRERIKGNFYSVVSLTPPVLIKFFNFGNDKKVPIVKLGH